MVVRVHRGQLDYFRRRARATPNEIIAVLLGKNIGPHCVQIYQIDYPKLKSSTPMEVEADGDDLDVIIDAAKEDGLSVIGYIHSHPGGPQYLSRYDLRSHIECGDRVTAICEVRNRRTHVTFWIENTPIPCKLEYLP